MLSPSALNRLRGCGEFTLIAPDGQRVQAADHADEMQTAVQMIAEGVRRAVQCGVAQSVEGMHETVREKQEALAAQLNTVVKMLSAPVEPIYNEQGKLIGAKRKV